MCSRLRLYKALNEMEVGTSFYINAINLTPGACDLLKALIKNGNVMPDKSDLEKLFTKEAVDKCMCGESLAPQGYYRLVAEI